MGRRTGTEVSEPNDWEGRHHEHSTDVSLFATRQAFNTLPQLRKEVEDRTMNYLHCLNIEEGEFISSEQEEDIRFFSTMVVDRLIEASLEAQLVFAPLEKWRLYRDHYFQQFEEDEEGDGE